MAADYFSRQLLAYALASFALQSPFGVSCNFLHHASLPTSGEQAVVAAAKTVIIRTRARRAEVDCMQDSGLEWSRIE